MRGLPRQVPRGRGAPLILLVAGALAADPGWGEVLAGLAGCRECHTRPGGAPFAGGYPLETRFGTFVGPNLTTDPDQGIGGWTEADFERAIRRGHGPDRRYWPVFPYGELCGMTDGDVADLWAYLRTVPPDPSPSVAQDVNVPRIGLWAWRLVVFRPHRFDGPLDRGEYLVEVVGHCTDCHSRRTAIGSERRRDHFAGNDQPPHGGPNLTPHPDGLAAWTEADWLTFLEVGMTPDDDFVGGGMRHVVRDGTARLSDEDRLAIARYMRALSPRADATR